VLAYPNCISIPTHHRWKNFSSLINILHLPNNSSCFT
jgi:hypothetical protein